MKTDIKKFLIGVQARSTSTRLPNKHIELLDGKRLIDHVLESCNSAARYLNRYSYKNGYETTVALLTPEGDKLVRLYSDFLPVIEGDEQDVLSRYVKAANKIKADYIVRITGDCPLIPPYVISKHIVLAWTNKYDYISNCDEKYRTTIDGVDCEVISRNLLDWLDENARYPSDREHVTIMLRKERPEWAKMGLVTGFFDLSKVKMSVDTISDLIRVRDEYDNLLNKRKYAEKEYGKDHVHRF